MIPAFGWSAGDIVKLAELTGKVYLAFKDANNSTEQVRQLVHECERFTAFLQDLARHLETSNRKIPWGSEDFKKTRKDFEDFLEKYKRALLERKGSLEYTWRTVKLVFQEKDVERLRKRLDRHYICLNAYMNFWQLEDSQPRRRSNFMAPIAEESLINSDNPVGLQPIRRTRSFRVRSYAGLSQPERRNGFVNLDPEAEEQYRELERFKKYVLGESKKAAHAGEPQWSDRLIEEVNIAMVRTQELAKRRTAEMIERASLEELLDARLEVESRPGTLDASTQYEGTEGVGLGILPRRPSSRYSVESPTLETPTGGVPISPGTTDGLLPSSEHAPGGQSPCFHARMSSTSSSVSYSTSPRGSLNAFQFSPTQSYRTTPTTPIAPIQQTPAVQQTLGGLDIGPAALSWACVVKSARVEFETRASKGSHGSWPCAIYTSYAEDGTLSIRAQRIDADDVLELQFPAARIPIPFAAHGIKNDGTVYIKFKRGPQGSGATTVIRNITYTLYSEDDSKAFQKVLYGQDLLFSRNIRAIHTDRYNDECKNQSLRLFSKHDTLTLLFYTENAPVGKRCWVEEPHVAFERPTDKEISNRSKKATLQFEKSTRKRSIGHPSTQPSRVDSFRSAAMSAEPASWNKQGFKRLEIEFQSEDDRKAFMALWERAFR